MIASVNATRVMVEPVRGTVPTGAAGATGVTGETLHSHRRRRSREELRMNRMSMLHLARGIAVGAVPSAIAGVASSADLAGLASPTDLAGVASPTLAEMASSAVAEVAPSAVAEVASSTLAEAVSSTDLAGVASLADPTVSVISREKFRMDCGRGACVCDNCAEAASLAGRVERVSAGVVPSANMNHTVVADKSYGEQCQDGDGLAGHVGLLPADNDTLFGEPEAITIKWIVPCMIRMADGPIRAFWMTLFVCGPRMTRSWARRWDYRRRVWWIWTLPLCLMSLAFVRSTGRSGAAG